MTKKRTREEEKCQIHPPPSTSADFVQAYKETAVRWAFVHAFAKYNTRTEHTQTTDVCLDVWIWEIVHIAHFALVCFSQEYDRKYEKEPNKHVHNISPTIIASHGSHSSFLQASLLFSLPIKYLPLFDVLFFFFFALLFFRSDG
mmetsp:Transcript_25690/g.64661  ORF Transcript_25690/g.64661 Transcript_25690/m.64661 type:complete len:144 (-) Transcript_25690:1782-2213(-)